ncbi:hypothetical protein ABW21_db0204600 [Orbilia brochopaga]|nr:hypothetical protein ABW21_db0204600 [Drechslerella brochopaga]
MRRHNRHVAPIFQPLIIKNLDHHDLVHLHILRIIPLMLRVISYRIQFSLRHRRWVVKQRGDQVRGRVNGLIAGTSEWMIRCRVLDGPPDIDKLYAAGEKIIGAFWEV